jgi:hypothetical protein
MGGTKEESLFLLLMSVLSQTLFTFVSGHFVSFSFFSAWHILYLKCYKSIFCLKINQMENFKECKGMKKIRKT